MNYIKLKLSHKREEMNKTLDDVAKILNEDYDTISNKETGDEGITLEQIEDLAEFYDCEIDELIEILPRKIENPRHKLYRLIDDLIKENDPNLIYSVLNSLKKMNKLR